MATYLIKDNSDIEKGGGSEILKQYVPERIIVSIASFDKRINNWIPCLTSWLNQTVKPDKIILNLCTEDFPLMEENFPVEVKEFLEANNNIIEVYWFIENYIQWKKLLYVYDIAQDNDLILLSDDDKAWQPDIIERMYMSYVHFGKEYPVTMYNSALVNNMFLHCGWCSLYKKSDLCKDGQSYKKYLIDDFWNTNENDFLTTIFHINNKHLMPCIYGSPKTRYSPDGEDMFTDLDKTGSITDCADSGGNKSDIAGFYKRTYDFLHKTFFQGFFHSDPEEIRKINIYPEQWTIAAIYHEYLKAKTVESGIREPVVDFLLDVWDKNFLNYHYVVPRHQIGVDRKYEQDRLLLSEGKRVNVVVYYSEKYLDTIESVVKNTYLPDYIVLYISRPDFCIPEDNTPSICELKNIIKDERLNQFITENPFVKIRYFDETVSGLSDIDKKDIVEEYFPDDTNIILDTTHTVNSQFIETILKDIRK